MFSKFELTDKGVELLNKVIAEKKTLKFTKFQLGKGEFSGDKKTLAQLVSKFDEFNVTQTSVLSDGITNIKGFYDNRNLNTESKLTEIGIFAQAGDDTLTEVLFSYTNQPSTDAETIPSKESYFSRTFSVMNRTDNVTSITFDLTIRQDKYNFGTLEEMKAADYLDVGDKVALWGNTELGDSSFKLFIITNEIQSIQLNNTLFAKEYLDLDDKQNVIDNALKTNSKNIPGGINEVYDFMNYTLYNGVISEIGPQYKKTTFKETLYALYDARKLPKILYIVPKDFTDLSEWLYQDIKQEFTILTINSSYGIKGVSQISDKKDSRFFYSWTRNAEINSLKLDNYASGIKKTEIIQTNTKKIAGNGYIDTVSNELYYCFKDAPSSITSPNSEYFIKATNIENAKQSLQTYYNACRYRPLSSSTVQENIVEHKSDNMSISLDTNKRYITIPENGLYVCNVNLYAKTEKENSINIYKNTEDNAIGYTLGFKGDLGTSGVVQCVKGDKIYFVFKEQGVISDLYEELTERGFALNCYKIK